MQNNNEKYIPNVGEELYLYSSTGDYWCDAVKTPYTVIEVTNTSVIIQEARLIFSGPRYYDTYPDRIIPDPTGEKLTLRWSKKKQLWQVDKLNIGTYSYAKFGKYEYSPYLN